MAQLQRADSSPIYFRQRKRSSGSVQCWSRHDESRKSLSSNPSWHEESACLVALVRLGVLIVALFFTTYAPGERSRPIDMPN
jgi:hypothetical protein